MSGGIIMQKKGKIVNIGSSKLDEIIEENNCVIIDLRDEEEYKESHIKGAKNIPYIVFEKQKDVMENDKKIVLYCDSGGTSIYCAKLLAIRGMTVYNLLKGIENYKGKYFNKAR